MIRVTFNRLIRAPGLALAISAAVGVSAERASAQDGPARAELRAALYTRADALLEAGRWSEAEDAFYAQSRVHPREPLARAALGRYLATKGAIVPGTILIEEAQKFGLDPAVSRMLLTPWRKVLRGRGLLRVPLDTARGVGPETDSLALFRVALSSTTMRRGAARQWVTIVPRVIGIDSLASGALAGTETVEPFMPSYDVVSHQVTFHADPRSALAAIGHRYPVLRDERDIRVLVAPGRVVSFAPAMRELAARWWQLDLVHGFVVVR